MAKSIWVPMHLDALVLNTPEGVVGPTLDLATAPWFGDDGEKVARDHFSNIANVSSAMRADPMSPDNRILQVGTHLHWALPDALTHGTTENPEHPAYVDRGGLWFPKVPNRWVVLRKSGAGFATVDKAWMVQSDFVHPVALRGQDSETTRHGHELQHWKDMHATIYPIPPKGLRDQPYIHLGRSFDLSQPLPTQQSDRALADYDAGLTAVGHGDPAFGALYTGCHSVFGLHDIDALNGDVRYEIIGWYADEKDEPLSHWKALGQGPLPPEQDKKEAELYSRFQKLTGWALSDVGALFADDTRLAFTASVDIKAGTPDAPKPDAVKGTAAVGISTTEALAALVSKGDADLEHMMEAIGFHTELADHKLDYGAKLNEARHSAGFTTTGKKTVWTLRRPEDAVSDPITGAVGGRENAHAALPDWIAQELNRLNVAQDVLDHARDVAEELRAQMYADWQLYMRAAYPADDRADFALDVDLLRDVFLVKSIADFEEAEADLDPDNQGSSAALHLEEYGRMATLLRDLATKAPKVGALELVAQAGPRFTVPNDPVIATKGAAFKRTRRHGHDGRARADGTLDCVVAPLGSLPVDVINAAQAQSLLASLDGLRTTQFDAIARFSPTTLRSWNALMLEWQASVKAYRRDTNMRADIGRYDAGVITNNFALRQDDCELSLRTAIAAGDLVENDYYMSGRTILNLQGPQQLEEALKVYDDEGPKLSATQQASVATLTKRVGDAVLANNGEQTISTSLDGFNARLLMRVLEEQVPISDPLGFEEDQKRAGTVLKHVGNPNGFWSAETEAPFLPLRAAKLKLAKGRIIDSFGQHVPWYPGGENGTDVIAAASLREDGASGMYLPPRSAQPARVDFRWLDAQNDLVQSNDHPASSPLCGWIVPNNLDNDVLVYDVAGQLLGIIDLEGIWRPAPGDLNAPAGPGLIGNAHLSRVAQWITRNGSKAFIAAFLDTLDSALSSIEPPDFSVQNATALLVGRPIAVARAMLDFTLQGPPAQDQSQQALAARIGGAGWMDHGFGKIEFPMRLGEHGQLNDGLVGYFRVDEDVNDGHTHFYAPQSSPSTVDPIKTYAPLEPITLNHSFDDDPKMMTLLLDPRCPVHLTTGILPTKAIRIPQDQFMPSLRALEMTFAAMPVLTPPNAMHLPLPRISGQSWSWLALENGAWQSQSGRATVSLVDLRKAFPGRIEVSKTNVVKLLVDGDAPATDATVTKAADLLWSELIAHKWITEIESGRAFYNGPPAADSPALGYIFENAEIQTLLGKIAVGIQPTTHTATFGARPVAREGWLKLTPNADDT